VTLRVDCRKSEAYKKTPKKYAGHTKCVYAKNRKSPILLSVTFVLSPQQLVAKGIKKVMIVRANKDNRTYRFINIDSGVHWNRK
jgi:hypothetical protein